MQIDGGQAFAENAVLEPATVDPLQLADGGDVQILDRLRTGEILAMMDVLDHHETDERLVGMMMVEGEFHQPAQRVGGAQMLEIELGFGGADLPVGFLKDGQVETFLVPEIVIDHPLARASHGGDVVDPGPGQAVLGKVPGGDLDDVLSCGLGTAYAGRGPAAEGFCCLCHGQGFTHAQIPRSRSHPARIAAYCPRIPALQIPKPGQPGIISEHAYRRSGIRLCLTILTVSYILASKIGRAGEFEARNLRGPAAAASVSPSEARSGLGAPGAGRTDRARYPAFTDAQDA